MLCVILRIEHSFLSLYGEAAQPRRTIRTVLSLHNLGVSQSRQMWRLRGLVGEKPSFVLKWPLLRGWEARYAGRC
jgi:hypothetical protein